jgi:D-amino-acid dehydrogenase
MRVAVIGAGIVGVCTAYELAADGHEVTVLDRRGGIAAEASFANAGLIAPGYIAPWAAPGMPWRIARQLFSRHAAVRWTPRPEPAHWAWIRRWLGACRKAPYLAHHQALLGLATYSQQRLRGLVDQRALEYERSDGCLVLLRTARDTQRAEAALALLREAGIAHALLSPVQARQVEPALADEPPLDAAVHLPGAEVGNCRQVAHLLRDLSEQRFNVDFRFATDVTQITPSPQGPVLRLEQLALSTGFGASRSVHNARVSREVTARRAVAAARFLEPVNDEAYDAVVLCGGAGSAALLPALGLKVPLQPVFGYSVTFQMRAAEHAPRSAVMDEHFKVAITRLGDRVRVAGAAEYGAVAERMHDGVIETLHQVMHDWFPSAANRARAQAWKGARPMLADGPPLIGAAPMPGVWLNLGHGSSGWALACGSARLLADQMAQRLPEVDRRPFDPGRYRA